MIFFIHKDQVPRDRFVYCTYAQFVCNLHPQKAEKHRTRMALGGNKINYSGDVKTPTAGMLLG